MGYIDQENGEVSKNKQTNKKPFGIFPLSHETTSRVCLVHIVMSGVNSCINKEEGWFFAQEESKWDSILIGLSSLLCRYWIAF